MQEHYAKSSKSLKVKGGFPVGSYWAVRDDSGTWYRGMIIPRGEVSCGQMNKCDNAREKVKVRYVDCGREETVDIKQIRRLHKDFRKMQILALRCSLHQVYPKSKWMVDPWAKASTDAFLEKCGGLMATLKAHFVLRNQLTEMYEVELHSEEGININKFMVKTGFAVLRLQNRGEKLEMFNWILYRLVTLQNPFSSLITLYFVKLDWLG
ncbi:hypothetical protein SK128_013138 [Halocaridina rubra]|uniref:Tudor domain-containing protein n=1 Tax=Halocaridina rubra TaxID=373956 RepID=A0AAN8XQ74_HALRR